MKYAYIVTAVLSFLLGSYIGAKFWSRTELRTVSVPVTTTKEVVKTKEIVKQADGTVIDRVVIQTKDSAKISPQPKAQYRVGALLPIASELKLPTVTAGRRLFGNVWAEASFDIRHKEVLLGLSYEF